MPDQQPSAGSSRRIAVIIGGIVLAFVTAIATAIGTGAGDDAYDLITPDDPLVTWSVTEEFLECGTHVYFPRRTARRLAKRAPPDGTDWVAWSRDHGGHPAGSTTVELSIQGESARPVTLTGIDFVVKRTPRSKGATFSNPCGGAAYGRALVVDLDRHPPAIIASTSDPEGIPGARDSNGRSVYKPLRFPWTVSLTDPLLLRISATTKRCDCVWRAVIEWKSGGKTGEIAIDNGGAGFRVVGDAGDGGFTNAGSKWERHGPLPVG